MLADVLSPANYLMINKDAIRIFGLQTAVYASELAIIYKKACVKKAFIHDDYFRVDRGYIAKEIYLTDVQQLECDQKLKQVNLVQIDEENSDVIRFDIEAYGSVLAGEDIRVLSSISETVANSKAAKAFTKDQKQKRRLDFLKQSIKCKDFDILKAMQDWVESIYTNKGFLSDQQVEVFMDSLNEYCAKPDGTGNKELALKIIATAISINTATFKTAVKCYEQQNATNPQVPNTQVRVTEQRIARTRADLAKEGF